MGEFQKVGLNNPKKVESLDKLFDLLKSARPDTKYSVIYVSSQKQKHTDLYRQKNKCGGGTAMVTGIGYSQPPPLLVTVKVGFAH